MPMYEYTCEHCRTIFTILRNATCLHDVQCPECRATEVTKRMSSFNSCSSGCGSKAGAGGFGRFGGGFGGG